MFSSPKELRKIVGVTTEEIKRIMTSTRIDKLASIELKGALILPMIACQLELPCFIVRKADKGYGVAGRIAGRHS
jgi:orotate phosphoribosyltransferase